VRAYKAKNLLIKIYPKKDSEETIMMIKMCRNTLFNAQIMFLFRLNKIEDIK